MNNQNPTPPTLPKICRRHTKKESVALFSGVNLKMEIAFEVSICIFRSPKKWSYYRYRSNNAFVFG